MLRNMEPPVGFGKNCPYRLAYRKLIRMNMPVDENGCVNFTTTLLALIRESLGIKTGPTEIMDQRDMELKETICKLWPVHGKKMLNLLVPPDSGSQQETLDPGFVLLGTRQQGVPVILRELVLPGGFDLVSPSFTTNIGINHDLGIGCV
ncbi:unnamed protein product [Schistosoma margrebowiei]|uniref:Uncharacterized protein n=1 Tax=Schistosoma margrebowiei TaxID=48269 RepID=A0A183LWV4_9TREM|nr:unnamed protein product [Schistosoma margrebowiei]